MVTPSRPAPRRSRRSFLGIGAIGLASLLAACGPSGPTGQPSPAASPTSGRILDLFPRSATPTPSPTPEPVRLRFAYWQTDAAGDALGTLATAFGQGSPRVVVEPVVRSFADHQAALAAAFAGGSPPDVFLESGPDLESHRRAQGLLDLASLLGTSRLDLGRYWTDSTTRPIDGQQLSLPLWADLELLYYNRDVLGAAGLAPPSDTWTWTDFLSMAEKLTNGKPGEITRWGALVMNDLQSGWGGFVASNGSAWLDPATRRTALGSPAATEALRFVVELIVSHHAAPDPSEQQRITRAGQTNPFLDGVVALLPGGTWLMAPTLKAARFNWDVARLPRAPSTGKSVAPYSIQPVAAARAGAHRAEAGEFLRYLLGADAQGTLARGKARVPSLKDVAADVNAGYAAAPPSHLALASAALADARDLQLVPGWPAWRTAVVAALDPAFAGAVDLATALKQAVADGDGALAKT